MATPHINAEAGDFADVVLMPGDPLRAKYIAETFLQDAREVNNVRGMLGYTGTYKGRRISVMGHGMGIPSCSIYAKELITEFGVKTIIRVGSCGAVRSDVNLRDVVIGMGACTDSKVNRMRFKDHDFAAIADFDLVRNAVDAAKALGIDARVGNLFSADLFYTRTRKCLTSWKNTAFWVWKWKRPVSTVWPLSSVLRLWLSVPFQIISAPASRRRPKNVS